MPYLRNAWTVAAWATELQPGQLLARTLLDEPLVFFRDAQGGAAVQCPYHGAERHSARWIWMGDAALADTAPIPDFGFNDPAHGAVGTGSMVVDAPYELEIDNIPDLSHIEFMHPLFASEAGRRARVTSEQDGSTVSSKRFRADDREVPAFLRQAFQVPDGALDRCTSLRSRSRARRKLDALIAAEAAG